MRCKKTIESGRRASLLAPSARKVVTSRTIPASVGTPTVPKRFSYSAFGKMMRI